MDEKAFNRSEYIKALNASRTNYQNYNPSLINTMDNSTDVGNELSSLAYVDTRMPTNAVVNSNNAVTNTKTKEEDSNWFSKLVGTFDQVVSDVRYGFLKGIEGVFDFGANTLGAMGWEDASNWAKIDISRSIADQYDAFHSPFNFITSMAQGKDFGQYITDTFQSAGNVFRAIGGDESAVKDQSKLAKQYDNFDRSLIKDTQVGQFVSGISQSIGEMLPSIIVGNVLGATAIGGETALAIGKETKTVAELVSLAQFGVSAGGNAMEQNLQKGMSSQEALGRGVVAGAIETGTEMIPWGAISKFLPSNKLAGIGSKTFREFGGQMLEEGLEEVIGDVATWITDSVIFGDNRWDEAKTPEFYSNLGMSFLSGAVVSGVMGGTNVVANKARYGKLTELDSIYTGLNEAQKESMNVLSNGGELSEDFLKGVGVENARAYELINEAMSTEKGRKQLKHYFTDRISMGVAIEKYCKENNINSYEDLTKEDFDKIYNGKYKEELNAFEKGSTIEGAREQLVQPYVEEYSKLAKEIYGDDVTLITQEDLKSQEAFERLIGRKLTQQEVNDFNNAKGGIDSFHIGSNSYVLPENVNKHIKHESITHGFLDQSQVGRDKVINAIKSTQEGKEVWDETFSKIQKKYGRMAQNKSNSQREELFISETLANIMENYANMSKIYNAMDTTNKKGISNFINKLQRTFTEKSSNKKALNKALEEKRAELKEKGITDNAKVEKELNKVKALFNPLADLTIERLSERKVLNEKPLISELKYSYDIDNIIDDYIDENFDKIIEEEWHSEFEWQSEEDLLENYGVSTIEEAKEEFVKNWKDNGSKDSYKDFIKEDILDAISEAYYDKVNEVTRIIKDNVNNINDTLKDKGYEIEVFEEQSHSWSAGNEPSQYITLKLTNLETYDVDSEETIRLSNGHNNGHSNDYDIDLTYDVNIINRNEAKVDYDHREMEFVVSDAIDNLLSSSSLDSDIVSKVNKELKFSLSDTNTKATESKPLTHGVESARNRKIERSDIDASKYYANVHEEKVLSLAKVKENATIGKFIDRIIKFIKRSKIKLDVNTATPNTDTLLRKITTAYNFYQSYPKQFKQWVKKAVEEFYNEEIYYLSSNYADEEGNIPRVSLSYILEQAGEDVEYQKKETTKWLTKAILTSSTTQGTVSKIRESVEKEMKRLKKNAMAYKDALKKTKSLLEAEKKKSSKNTDKAIKAEWEKLRVKALELNKQKTKQRAKLEELYAKKKSQLEKEFDTKKLKNNDKLRERRKELNKNYDTQMAIVKQNYDKRVKKLSDLYNSRMSKIKSATEEKIAKIKSDNEKALAEIEANYKEKITKLQSKYDNDMQALKDYKNNQLKEVRARAVQHYYEKVKINSRLETALKNVEMYKELSHRTDKIRKITKQLLTYKDRFNESYNLTDDNIERDGLLALIKPFTTMEYDYNGKGKGYKTGKLKSELNLLLEFYNNSDKENGFAHKYPELWDVNIYNALTDLRDSLPDEQIKELSNGSTRVVHQFVDSNNLQSIISIIKMITHKSKQMAIEYNTNIKPSAQQSYDIISNSKYGKKKFKGDIFTGLFGKYKRGFAPSYVVIRNILGENSYLADLATTQYTKARNQMDWNIGLYNEKLNAVLRENNLLRKLDKKITFRNHKMTYGQLIYLYNALQVNSNFKAIDESGVGFIDNTNGKKHYTLAEKGQADVLKEEVTEALSPEHIKVANFILETFNNDFKQQYIEWFENNYGEFQGRNEIGKVGENTYWSIIRYNPKITNVEKAIISPAVFKNSKSRQVNTHQVLIGDAMSAYTTYLQDLSTERFIKPIYREIISVLNTKTNDGNSIWAYLNNDAHINDRAYLKTTLSDMVGALEGTEDLTTKIVSSFSVAKLSLNIGTMLKQFASIYTSNIPLSNSTKAMFMRYSDDYKSEFKKLSDGYTDEKGVFHEGLGGLAFRENKKGTIDANADGLSGKAKRIAEIGMYGISKVDKFTINTGVFSLMIIGQNQFGYKIGSEENIEFVKEHWGDFELTQIANNALSKNAIARGDHGTIAKAIFGFMQGANRASLGAQITKADLWVRNHSLSKSQLEENLKSSKNSIDNFEKTHKTIGEVEDLKHAIELFKKRHTSTKRGIFEFSTLNSQYQNEYNKLEEMLERAKKDGTAKFNAYYLSESEKTEYANLKQNLIDAEVKLKDYRQYEISGGNKIPLNMISGLIAQGIFITIINELIKRLKGKKDWDEWDARDIGLTALMSSGVDWVPMVNAISNMFQGYEVTIPVTDLMNQMVDIIKDGKNGNWNKMLTEICTLAGDATGVPVSTIYQYIYGIVKPFRPDIAFQTSGILYGTSLASATSAMQTYANKKDISRTASMMEIVMDYCIGETSEEVNKELSSLFINGYNALPTQAPTSYTSDNGETVQYTAPESQALKKYYALSKKQIEQLIKNEYYQNLTDEEKAKAIKKIYNYYLDYAKNKVLNKNSSSRGARLLQMSNGKVNVGKYVPFLSAISSITDTKKATRKELVLQYINKVKGLSKQDRLMLAYLAGYSLSDANKKNLSTYLKILGGNKEMIKEEFSSSKSKQ